MIAIAAAAVLAGSKSVLAIGGVGGRGSAPHVVLEALGSRRSPRTGRFTAPHGDTFRRVLRDVDADAVDTIIGAFLAERVAVGVGSPPAPDDDGQPDERTADPSQNPSGHRDEPRDEPIVAALSVDGKAVRGARRDDRRAVHLLAATVHGVPAVLAQRDVAHKTNEITQVKPLLAPLDLTGWAVTLDALHCQRETARSRSPTPCASAAMGGSTNTVLHILAAQADPERLATLVRGHWGIEALHHVRHVTFDEDRSQLRKGAAPQILAGLRNLAVGVLHTARRTKIASSLRWVPRDPTRTIDILSQPA